MRSQFTLHGLFLLTASAAVGLSFWKLQQDWYFGGLAAFSFWIVLGVAAQSRDIRHSLRQNGDLASDERWGLRFAFTWRLALCCLLGLCFAVRSIMPFRPFVFDPGLDNNAFALFFDQDLLHISPSGIWTSLLLCSIIAVIIGSRNIVCPAWRRPWSWAVYVFRGFVAGLLFLMILEDRQILPYLVHVTIVGMLSAMQSPCGYVPDIATEMTQAASRTRVTLYYDIATAGVLSLLVNGVLAWHLSVRWRSGGWQKACLAVLLATGLTVMLLLTAEIVFVEIPTMSPVMVANTPALPTLSWIAAALLAMGLAVAIAGRWATSPPSTIAPTRAAWRRNPWRYYHERPILLLPLGALSLAQFGALGYMLCTQKYSWVRNWHDALYWVTSPILFLPLILSLLTVQAAFRGISETHSNAIATEQPRLTPGLFLSVWFASLAIVVCSAPIIGAWHFASFLRSGYIGH